jgi:hypothetical protein
MIDKHNLRDLTRAKLELTQKLPLELINTCSHIGVGLRDHAIYGNGGELEKELKPMYTSGNLCLRVRLNKMPSPQTILPSSYRGIPIGYFIS